MVARLPESDAIMDGFTFTSRAHQLAEEPESQVRMTSSGSRDDISQKTRCGLMGSASDMARSSIMRHHSFTSSSTFSRQPRSLFFSSMGISAWSVSLESPWRLTSMG